MKEALQGIKKDGGKLIVITNKPQNRAVEVVEELFGKNYFDLIVGFLLEFSQIDSRYDGFDSIILAKCLITIDFFDDHCNLHSKSIRNDDNIIAFKFDVVVG